MAKRRLVGTGARAVGFSALVTGSWRAYYDPFDSRAASWAGDGSLDGEHRAYHLRTSYHGTFMGAGANLSWGDGEAVIFAVQHTRAHLITTLL